MGTLIENSKQHSSSRTGYLFFNLKCLRQERCEFRHSSTLMMIISQAQRILTCYELLITTDNDLYDNCENATVQGFIDCRVEVTNSPLSTKPYIVFEKVVFFYIYIVISLSDSFLSFFPLG